MDNKALFKLTYGVFVLGTTAGDKMNACITNTAMQVASNPDRIAICCINANYTCDLIKESGSFALTLLDQTCTFETISHFGFQSGRDVDKFESLTPQLDVNGNPYLGYQSCAVISGKVVDSMDLGSHTMFIAEIDDMKVLSDNDPLTYADYHAHVKPKPEAVKEDKKIVAWRCKICGYIYEGADIPDDFKCPLCGHPKEDFEPIYEGEK